MSDPTTAPATVDADLRAIIAEQLKRDGWVCDFHEPNDECSQCADCHARTADRILAALTSAGWPHTYQPDDLDKSAAEREAQAVIERMVATEASLREQMAGAEIERDDMRALAQAIGRERDAARIEVERLTAERDDARALADEVTLRLYRVAVQRDAERERAGTLARELAEVNATASRATQDLYDEEQEHEALRSSLRQMALAAGGEAEALLLLRDKDGDRSRRMRFESVAGVHLAVAKQLCALLDDTTAVEQAFRERDDLRERADTLARSVREVRAEMRDAADYWHGTDTGRRLGHYADVLGELLDGTTPASEPRIVACTRYSGQFGQPHEQGCAALEALTAAERERDDLRERADTLARGIEAIDKQADLILTTFAVAAAWNGAGLYSAMRDLRERHVRALLNGTTPAIPTDQTAEAHHG